VNVSLSKIVTNTELQSVFFDDRYYIQGEDVPVKMCFKDVIFVLEDIDAASNVVKRRDGKKTAEVTEVENIEYPGKSTWRLLLESSDSDVQELVEELMEKSDRLKNEATKPEVVKSLVSGISELPGLSLVGSKDSALSKLGAEALELADSTMNGKETLDRYLSMYVKPLKSLLAKGAEVSDVLVDELLSIPGTAESIPQREASREISYEYTDNQSMPEIFLKKQSDLAAVIGPSPQDDADKSDKAKKVSSPLDFLQVRLGKHCARLMNRSKIVDRLAYRLFSHNVNSPAERQIEPHRTPQCS